MSATTMDREDLILIIEGCLYNLVNGDDVEFEGLDDFEHINELLGFDIENINIEDLSDEKLKEIYNILVEEGYW